MSLLRWKKLLPFISIMLVIAVWIFCTQKENPVGPQQTPVVKTPTLAIVSPASDTIVDNSTDSILIKARIVNSTYVDSLKVNGTKISPFPVVNDTLSKKFKLTSDTSKLILSIFYQQGLSLYDTIQVTKKAALVVPVGMAKISGTLLQESNSTLAKKLNKALKSTNAQGITSVVSKVLPISGADVMVYNAQTLSTASDTVIKTDSLGKWGVELKPGNYFVFAVYFDKTNLEIVTTALPDIKAEKDKETKTDSAVATSDDIKPMLMSFHDAAEISANNTFLPGKVPTGLPLVMSFSEPMTRVSIGDSIHGIVLGTINTDSSDTKLLDTLPLRKLWGPDGKELRLQPLMPLTAGKSYKVIIPSTCKDLALNKLDKDYSGIFEVITAATLLPFALKSTVPVSGDTILPGLPVEVIFSRPLDALSLNKKYTFTSISDSTISGFFEVKGNCARFVNKKLWVAGAKYSLSILAGTKDLLGDSLGKDTAITFYIKPKDSIDQKIGIEGMVAAAIKKFMGAYIAGDIENFSTSFHQAFELIETDQSGQISRVQLTTFLEDMRSEIEERNRLSKFGMIAPIFYYPIVDGKRYIAWKLTKGTNAFYFEFLGKDGGFGKIPRILSINNKDITDSVKFIPRGVVYKNDTLYFSPDMSKSFIDEASLKNDPRMYGQLLRNATNVETQDIKMALKADFIFRNLIAKEGNDTAQVMIELTQEERFVDGKRPDPIFDTLNPPPLVNKRVMAIQTRLLQTSGKWMVIQMAAKNVFDGDIKGYNAEIVKKDSSFTIKTFEQTRAIEFVTPKHKSILVKTPINLKWKVENKAGIGGYLVAIANELSGGNQGLLIFTRRDSLIINSDGSIEGGNILSIDPKSITVPIPKFSSKLTSFAVADSDVYVWKVIALPDTSFGSIVSGGVIQVRADSDFGSHGGGVGIFTLLDKMPDISAALKQQTTPVNQNEDRFADRDNDLFPNWIEKAFGTSPDDPGNYPNFSLDSDLDNYPDFMENFAGSKFDDATSKPVDVNPADNIADTLQKRPEWRPELAKDDDKDGFPNEMEVLFGTDPWNKDSKPSKSIKPSVPVNKYFGGLKLGDQGWKRVNFSLVSDSTGDFAILDTAEIEGIAKNGVKLSQKLFWMNGEWVFFLNVVTGPNIGKFIKIRFHKEGNNIRGPVDLADMENGGGPCIGEFFASIDTIKDFNNIAGGQPNQINNNNNNGPVNLGPPPMDRVKRPDSGSIDLRFMFAFTEGAPISLTFITKTDSITVASPFWNPFQSPAIGFNMPQSAKQYRLDGSYHRIGGGSAEKDTLVLLGAFECNVDNGNGGMIKQRYDYIVFITGITDPKKPSGTWTGWYTKPTGPVNQGPVPFIGTKDTVLAALKRTDSMAIIIESGKIVKIASTAQDGNIWTAMVDTSKLFIMEKTGDFASIMFRVIDGKARIVLSSKGPGGPGPINPPNNSTFFGGDSIAIINALTNSQNDVKVNAPSPFTTRINPATLKKEFLQGDPARFQWVAFDATNQQRKCVFLAVQNTPGTLRIEDGKPVVNEMMVQQPNNNFVPFRGDSSLVVSALTGSQNNVKIAADSGKIVTVNPTSVVKQRDPADSSKNIWIVSDAMNPQRKFVLLAFAQSIDQLATDGKNPFVKEMQQQPVNNTLRFAGDSVNIVTALAASQNNVRVASANPMTIVVNPSTLRREILNGDTSKAQWIVLDATNPQNKCIFLAINIKTQLRIENNVPVVELVQQQQQPARTPFTGDSTIVRNALTTSNNMVAQPGSAADSSGVNNQIPVDPASLRRTVNPADTSKFGYTVNKEGAPADVYMFMGQANNAQMLQLKGNLPVVFKP